MSCDKRATKRVTSKKHRVTHKKVKKIKSEFCLNLSILGCHTISV